MSYEDLIRQENLDKADILGQKLSPSKRVLQEAAIDNQILDRVPAFLITLQDHKISYVNAAFEAILGFKQDEIVHMNWEKLIHPDCRALVSSSYKNIMKDTGGRNQYEVKLLSKDEKSVWVDLSYNTVNTSGQLSVIISAYDITHSKLTKQVLQLSEARYRAIIEDQAELVGRFTVNNQLTFVNEAFCHAFFSSSWAFFRSVVSRPTDCDSMNFPLSLKMARVVHSTHPTPPSAFTMRSSLMVTGFSWLTERDLGRSSRRDRGLDKE